MASLDQQNRQDSLIIQLTNKLSTKLTESVCRRLSMLCQPTVTTLARHANEPLLSNFTKDDNRDAGGPHKLVKQGQKPQMCSYLRHLMHKPDGNSLHFRGMTLFKTSYLPLSPALPREV